MANFERVVTTFTRGELSPRVIARIDYEGRFDGVERLRNFLVMVQGGALKRAGTRFAAPAKDHTGPVRLVPFRVSVLQNYAIEATHLAFRFYADVGRVEVGGTPIEVGTPYTSDDLARLKWTQSADVLFLAHPNHRPRELRRTSAVTFQLVNYVFKDGPYLDVNTTETTLSLSGTSGSVTVTASATEGINNGQGFLGTDVGRLIRWKDPGGEWTWLEITARNSATEVTAEIKGDEPSGGDATTEWRLGAWSATTGWPEVCTFYQGRLWWGRTRTQPQTFWGTVPASIDEFTPSDPDDTVADDHAVTFTIDSNQVNAISWMIGTQRGLEIGTIAETWLARSADSTSGISPLSIEVVPQGAWGADDTILPVRIGASVVYVQHGRTVIHESAFNFDEDAFTSNNISILSEHLFRKGVRRLAFQEVPFQTVWALLEDGTVAGFTFDKTQQVLAWHHHDFGGEVLDICAIDSEHIGRHHEHLWMVVRRTIGGQQRHYVEFLEVPFDGLLDTIEQAYFVDCGLDYEGPPTNTLTGLDHLEGEEVAVLVNGSPQPNKVVSGGRIMVDPPATTAHVGLPYRAEILTLPLEAPQREGPFVSPGKIKRAHRATVRFLDTVGAKVGPDGGPYEEIPFRTPTTPMDQPVQPFNGTKRVSIEATWDEESRVQVLSEQPLPCTVTSIVTEAQIYGV